MYTLLILDEQFVWLYPFVYPSILTDKFENGLWVKVELNVDWKFVSV